MTSIAMSWCIKDTIVVDYKYVQGSEIDSERVWYPIKRIWVWVLYYNERGRYPLEGGYMKWKGYGYGQRGSSIASSYM